MKGCVDHLSGEVVDEAPDADAPNASERIAQLCPTGLPRVAPLDCVNAIQGCLAAVFIAIEGLEMHFKEIVSIAGAQMGAIARIDGKISPKLKSIPA